MTDDLAEASDRQAAPLGAAEASHARLIGAAPDMLAALEGLLEQIDPESIDTAIYAVAKATGVAASSGAPT